jgi:MtN3 and saliva related transmembrane protein
VIQAFGAAAGLCSMASFTPQLVKIAREKHAQGVSLGAYLMMVAGFSLWVVYGLLLRSWPVALSNAVNLALAAAILALKFRYPGRPPRTSRNAMPMAKTIRPAARKKGAPTRL